MAEKAKPKRPLTFKEVFNIKTMLMNAHILRHAMVVQRWNDQKVISHVCAKA
jgi:hypothetical protein